jgi:hypothetical protein
VSANSRKQAFVHEPNKSAQCHSGHLDLPLY